MAGSLVACMPVSSMQEAECSLPLVVPWQIEVVASTEEDFRTWDGWVHSRLRQLVMRVEPHVTVRPWPKAVKPPRPAEQMGQPVRCFYFMGLKKKAQPVQPGSRTSSVNLNTPVQEFKMQARPCSPWFRLRAGTMLPVQIWKEQTSVPSIAASPCKTGQQLVSTVFFWESCWIDVLSC